MKSVNTQLAALFDAATNVDRAVAQAVHEANAAGVLDLSPYVERLRKAHAWCGEVRTYYQVCFLCCEKKIKISTKNNNFFFVFVVIGVSKTLCYGGGESRA